MDEIQKFPGAELLSGKKPAQVRASHLLVKHKGSRRPSSWKEEHITRSKEEAIELLHQYAVQIDGNPDKFAELASKHSDCSSHGNSGDLGWFQRGSMQKPFEDATYALSVGEMSNVVDTDSGVHLILRTGLPVLSPQFLTATADQLGFVSESLSGGRDDLLIDLVFCLLACVYINLGNMSNITVSYLPGSLFGKKTTVTFCTLSVKCTTQVEKRAVASVLEAQYIEEVLEHDRRLAVIDAKTRRVLTPRAGQPNTVLAEDREAPTTIIPRFLGRDVLLVFRSQGSRPRPCRLTAEFSALKAHYQNGYPLVVASENLGAAEERLRGDIGKQGDADRWSETDLVMESLCPAQRGQIQAEYRVLGGAGVPWAEGIWEAI
ncbi:hypothetical protein EW145_g1362 [Phellinidium pouzarii]|uniref:peptidylprolyl isomerase n=1 Tax=Phellinidium pouzarii TaxID=167371 RepID=A0A4S4LET4_9AGAM|nr:hypothetical protein EW145_g1362 [Phellinidium pouzarii]